MASPGIRILRPRVLAIRRADPRRLSLGDEVLVEVTSGLLEFLDLRDARGHRLGAGLGLEWWLALGGAATGASCVDPLERGWFGISASIDFVRPVVPGETLRARSVVERIEPERFAHAAVVHAFDVVGEERSDPIARGIFVMGTARAGAAGVSPVTPSAHTETPELPPSSSPLPPHFGEHGEASVQALMQIVPPQLLSAAVASASPTSGDHWEWTVPAGLFRLLVHPAAGGADPLARRLHPYAFASLGMAIDASMQVLPGSWPRHAEVRWLRPLTARTDFRLSLHLDRVDDGIATIGARVFEASVPIAHVRIAFARARG